MAKLIAKDTMNISAVQSGNILAGDAFEIDDISAKDLIKRGLAREKVAAASKPAPAAPDAPAPAAADATASKPKSAKS